MTYSPNSDLLFGYGGVNDISTEKRISPARNIEWRQPEENFKGLMLEIFKKLFIHLFILDPTLLKNVKNKTRNVIWIASNCVWFRRRIVNKIATFIDVDIYGKCGPLDCTKKHCNEILNSTYKFYLAFENSICPDYVTEKVFKLLEFNIIPVVLNGANMTDFLPPKSYIDANSFETVEKLVEYLKFLSNNPEEYVKYFWWRKYYKPWRGRVNLCKICEKVNDEEILKNGKTVKSFRSLHSGKLCSRPKIKRE